MAPLCSCHMVSSQAAQTRCLQPGCQMLPRCTWPGRRGGRAGQQASVALIQGVQSDALGALRGANAPQVRVREALQHRPHHQLLPCSTLSLPSANALYTEPPCSTLMLELHIASHVTASWQYSRRRDAQPPHGTLSSEKVMRPTQRCTVFIWVGCAESEDRRDQFITSAVQTQIVL